LFLSFLLTTDATRKKRERAKNGGERKILLNKPKRFYPTQDVPKPLPNHKKPKAPKLKKGIVPGSVLILLSGRFRGRRVVFLKQLASGLLLVTGPFKINGVPLRRVNQAYVIGTSTKVDLTNVVVDNKLDDKYFKVTKVAKDRKSKKTFFNQVKVKTPLVESRVGDQKAVDSGLIEQIRKVPHLKAYLGSSFTLDKGQLPHDMKF